VGAAISAARASFAGVLRGDGPPPLGADAASAGRQHRDTASDGRLLQLASDLQNRVAELETLLKVIPVGIAIASDRDCRNIRVNPSFATVLNLPVTGNASKTAVDGERPTHFRVIDPAGNEVPDEQLPMQVAARHGRETLGTELHIVHDDGRVARLLEYAAPLLDASGAPRGSVGVFVDLTERWRLEQQARTILESITDAFYLLDHDFRYVYVNQRALDYYGKQREALVGRLVWDAFPQARGSVFQEQFERAVHERRTVAFEVLSPVSNRWVDVRAYPSAEGLFVYFRDVTDRNRTEVRDRFLVRLDDATRTLTDPYQITQTAARLLGEHLRASRCAYADVSTDGQTFDVFGDYCDGVPSITGRYTVESFGEDFDRLSRAGAPFVVDDVDADPRTERVRAAYRQTQIGAVVSVPLLKSGRFVGAMSVHQATPRRWRTDDVELLRLVANRCWESISRASLTAALRDSEERLMQAVAMAELGTFDIDLATDTVTVNEPGRTIYGWAEDEALTFEKVQTHVHPEDREMVMKAVGAALEPGGPGTFEVEQRIVRTDSVQRWIRVRGRALFAHRDGAPVAVRCLGTYLDVTERRESEERRERVLQRERAARAEAERVIRMKDEFLATLSHELRTPLNAILGWSQLVRRRSVEGADLHGALEAIDRNAQAQARLVDDLLDMSRIVSGKIRLDVQPVEVPLVIQAALESIQPAADVKGIRLRASLEPQTRPVSGDPARLQQVIWNLLSNAVKFTPAGGRVDVALSAAESLIEITVRDTGVGIDPEFLPFIFERFRQQDSSPTRAHGGLGLGLSITKQLVELHGGAVHASSPGAGQGATFVVTLPAAQAWQVREPAPVTSARAREARIAAGTPSLRGVEVMVVDDEADARQLIRHVLERAGATVHAVASAAEALDELCSRQVDVLVSDIGMPDVDGYGLIARVRELPHPGASLPAIALTAYARTEDREKALGAGYCAHITKPVDVDELIHAVAAAAATDQ
jgi:PAS domain S-box-containing protein